MSQWTPDKEETDVFKLGESSTELLKTISFPTSPIYKDSYADASGGSAELEEIMEGLTGAGDVVDDFQKISNPTALPGTGMKNEEYQGALKYNNAPVTDTYIPDPSAAGGEDGITIVSDQTSINDVSSAKAAQDIKFSEDKSAGFGVGAGSHTQPRATIGTLLKKVKESITDAQYKSKEPEKGVVQ